MDDSVATGSGARLPAETAVISCSLGHTRAPAHHNSPCFYWKPETRYRARLAHTMYVYDGLTLQQVAEYFGISRQRAHQYVQAVDPSLDGRAVQKGRK